MALLAAIWVQLFSFLTSCFGVRRKKYLQARDFMRRFIPVIKITRDIRSLCSSIRGPQDAGLVHMIAQKIMTEFEPSAACAACFDRACVEVSFGPSLNEGLECILDLFEKISCSSSTWAKTPFVTNEMGALCARVEIEWSKVVELYLDNVCPLSKVGRKIKMREIERRIAVSVPRVPALDPL